MFVSFICSLIVAYYEAGLRVFDISNPYLPVEVGKVRLFCSCGGCYLTHTHCLMHSFRLF
jgi:hypothetical protein